MGEIDAIDLPASNQVGFEVGPGAFPWTPAEITACNGYKHPNIPFMTATEQQPTGSGAHSRVSAAVAPVIERARAALAQCQTAATSVQEPQWPQGIADLSADQRLLAGDLLVRIGVTPAAAADVIEVQRTWLHAGAMRRSADVEVVTILLRWWLSRPLNDAVAVSEVRATYDHLRRSHWWPQGPADLPLGAVLACVPQPVNEVISRIDALQLALAEGDEIPDNPEDLVALLWSSQPSARLIERLHDLRTNLLLCGLALQPEDITSLVRLALIDRPSDEVIHCFSERLRRLSAQSQGAVGVSRLMIADAVLLELLPEPVARVVTALVVIQAWMATRGHDTRSPRQIPGPSLSHHSR